MIDYCDILKQIFLKLYENSRVKPSLVASKVLLVPFISNFLKKLHLIILLIKKNEPVFLLFISKTKLKK